MKKMDFLKSWEDSKKKEVPLLQKDEKIQAKKKGRPKKPNMIRKHIKIDSGLATQIYNWVYENPGTTFTTFINQACREKLKKD